MPYHLDSIIGYSLDYHRDLQNEAQQLKLRKLKLLLTMLDLQVLLLALDHHMSSNSYYQLFEKIN